MAEEKTKTTLEKIESLIVDGNKEVLEKLSSVESRLDGRIDGLEEKIDGVDTRLDRVDTRLDRIEKTIKEVHSSLKNEIRVEDKLDVHMRQPAHAGV